MAAQNFVVCRLSLQKIHDTCSHIISEQSISHMLQCTLKVDSLETQCCVNKHTLGTGLSCCLATLSWARAPLQK